MEYATYKDGKIKYYWQGDLPFSIDSDPIDGVIGLRNWLLDIIPNNESILDIGCGIGHTSEIFNKANRNNKYIGVDNNQNFIDSARVKFPNYLFDIQDANFLEFGDDEFDNAILFSVIEMLPDFRKAIEEAVRVSKKRIIITMFMPLTDERTHNLHKVNEHGDYVVKVNKNEFLRFIYLFGTVTSYELKYKDKTEYWAWIINKSNDIKFN